ncbi:MAG TPA: hypothetical protein VK014_07230 [Cyclobacteriaceae bacterium]|nr:hypothetical protein [Cyclobacteriaceae bacterium]
MPRQPLRELLLAILLVSIGACQTESDLQLETYPENARLIRISSYAGMTMDDNFAVEEYEYASNGKLIKTTRPFYNNGKPAGLAQYDVYEYDDQGRLISIASHHSNQNQGFINLTNTYITYDPKGLKVKEKLEYPQINAEEQVLYQYDGLGRLIRKDHFDASQKLQRYSLFEYNPQGQLVKERVHDSNRQVMRTHLLHYEKGNNRLTEIFAGDKEDLLRRVRKTFDRNNNLILLQSEEIAVYSSATSFTQKYEYDRNR